MFNLLRPRHTLVLGRPQLQPRRGGSAMGGKQPKQRYYAIKQGWRTGVFHTTWDEARTYVEGFGKAVFKGFNTRADAESFVGGVAAQAQRRDRPEHALPSADDDPGGRRLPRGSSMARWLGGWAAPWCP
jgi:hypothetical protein